MGKALQRTDKILVSWTEELCLQSFVQEVTQVLGTLLRHKSNFWFLYQQETIETDCCQLYRSRHTCNKYQTRLLLSVLKYKRRRKWYYDQLCFLKYCTWVTMTSVLDLWETISFPSPPEEWQWGEKYMYWGGGGSSIAAFDLALSCCVCLSAICSNGPILIP
jgi:hypothetical protein